MKRTLSSIYLLAALSIFTNCKKSNNDPNYFIAATNNTTATFTTVSTFTDDHGSLTIIGEKLGWNGLPDEKLSIIIPKFAGKGIYNFDNEGIVGYGEYLKDGETVKNSVHGLLVIDEVTPSLTGTFNFTCSDSTRITDGKFSIINE